MPLYELTDSGILPVPPTTFSAQQLLERQDLQRLIAGRISAVDPDLLVITAEFGEFEDSKRRIDILAIDRSRNLVVVELKRTSDGGHAELQAIRYAAMVSSLTFTDLVRAHYLYQQKASIAGASESQSRSAILSFLEHSDDEDPVFTTKPRIVLIAADFSIEITTTVLWLNAQGLDIRAIRMFPYSLAGKTVVDIAQVLPLAEARDYQIQIKKKEQAAVEAESAGARREETMSILFRTGRIKPGTKLEILPEFRPKDEADDTAHPTGTFVATVAATGKKLIWRDGQSYSATNLTAKLTEEHGVLWKTTKTYMLWRIVGNQVSMWNEAEEVLTQEKGEPS